MRYLKQILILSILSLFFYSAKSQTTINLASQCNCEVLSGTVVPTPGAPTANAGNLYINTTTGQIYSFDGTTWTVVSEDTPDHDWYAVGGTTPPTSINDDITTQGRVGIGVASPLHPLHVSGAIRSDARRYFFGTGANLFVNGQSDLVYTSNSATLSKLRFYDSDVVFYGAVVGTSDGTNFGLNDKDNHWTFRSVHDQFLTMSIDNSEKVRILANGRMGIGTAGPTATLDVDGNARIRTLAVGTANEMELVVDGNGVIKKRMAGDNSSTNELPLAGNDIDIATTRTVNIEPILDFVHTMHSPASNATLSAGTGATNNIFLRGWFDGHVGLSGELNPAAGVHMTHDDGLIAEGAFGAGQSLSAGAGTRMVWSSKHAAFRAGSINGAQWDDLNIGNYSAGFGFSTRASGGFSFAGGNNAVADGDYSFAYGLSPAATGVNSVAIGQGAEASNINTIALGSGTVSNGNSTIAIGFRATASGTGSKTFGAQTLSTGFNAIAMGEHLFARSRGEISLGSYGTDYTPAGVTTWNGADRILNVGIGLDSMNRKDALTIFKSGLSRFNGHALIVTNSSVGDEALFLDNSGTGVGQTIIMRNATSVAAGQYISQKGLGIGQFINMENTASNSVGIRLFQNGLATAQDIVMNNTASTANGLYLRHNGLGYGQQIVMNNTSSLARGLDIVQKGRGDAIYIAINNTTSNNNLIDANNTGLGVGVYLQNANGNNGIQVLQSIHKGDGEALWGGGSIAQGGVAGTNKLVNGNHWRIVNAGNAAGTTGTTGDGVAGVSGHVWKTNQADLRNVQGGYFTTQYGPTSGTTLNSSARVAYVDAGGTPRKIDGTGAAGTIVKDISNEPVLMTAVESPEILFTDYGSAQLVNGKAVIKLDPNYTKNIVVDSKNEIKIFVQLEGDCNGVYVANKSATGFEVVELKGGNSNVRFSYEVVANRANVVENGHQFTYDSSKRFAPGPKDLPSHGETSESNEDYE